jgi:hypothetical protein
MVATNISRFERFFRQAAGIDVDKNDLKRHDDFVDQKLYDLLLRGEANAKANNRDVIEVWDLPITKGLQERVHELVRQARQGHPAFVDLRTDHRRSGDGSGLQRRSLGPAAEHRRWNEHRAGPDHEGHRPGDEEPVDHALGAGDAGVPSAPVTTV